MSPRKPNSVATVVAICLLSGCANDAKFAAGETPPGMEMRAVVTEPADDVSDQQVGETDYTDIETISDEPLQQRREELYDQLGAEEVALAEEFVEHIQQVPLDKTTLELAKEEFTQWGELSPDEVAVLPPEFQYSIPTIGCGQLNARTIVSHSIAGHTYTACQQHPDDPDAHQKYLMADVDITEDDVASATVEQVSGQWVVAVEFTEEGQREWSGLAENAGNTQVAILVGHQVVSAPTVQPDAAQSPALQITGDFTKSEADQLVQHISGT